ncbi:MAG: hypothetical protein JO015_14865 [Verrucomicrobia bacterium]|nr:hypothetical protein [Verrucomicrobiota bacterium]
MISVRKLDDKTFEVSVTAGDTATLHRVTLRGADRVYLAGTDTDAERLIEESFRFLLDREPNTSILGRFDLPVIGQYFPEYAGEMQRRFGIR